jgi:hypothetical protein
MSVYSEFFLNSQSSIIELDTLEISHSKFTRTYYVVRNAMDGITAKIEDGTYKVFQYGRMTISPLGASDDLEQIIKVSFGDLGEILPLEIDSVSSQDGFPEKPIIKRRIYRSNDLDNILFGPVTLEAKTFSFAREGATFEAKAPSLNLNRTGELYRFDRFPMLKGFL